MKFSKVRRTDYRTTGSAPAPRTGLDHLAANNAHEAANHDRAVADYPPHLIDSALPDINRHGPFTNRKDPETRWRMARKAALCRRAAKL
jgi:hypothetical protein